MEQAIGSVELRLSHRFFNHRERHHHKFVPATDTTLLGLGMTDCGELQRSLAV